MIGAASALGRVERSVRVDLPLEALQRGAASRRGAGGPVDRTSPRAVDRKPRPERPLGDIEVEAVGTTIPGAAGEQERADDQDTQSRHRTRWTGPPAKSRYFPGADDARWDGDLGLRSGFNDATGIANGTPFAPASRPIAGRSAGIDSCHRHSSLNQRSVRKRG